MFMEKHVEKNPKINITYIILETALKKKY